MLLVGLSFWGGETFSVCSSSSMDSFLNDWNRFSLTEKEVPYVYLTKDNNRSKSAFAAKFLTKLVLNIEATGQTFKPLWKTRRSFQAQDVRNHVINFVFETDNDAKRVLMNEPWRFDKHLVLFQRYESGSELFVVCSLLMFLTGYKYTTYQ